MIIIFSSILGAVFPEALKAETLLLTDKLQPSILRWSICSGGRLHQSKWRSVSIRRTRHLLLAERTLRALSSLLLCLRARCARHPNVNAIIETQHPAGAAAHAAKHELKANGTSINDLSLIHLIASGPPLPSVLPDKRQ